MGTVHYSVDSRDICKWPVYWAGVGQSYMVCALHLSLCHPMTHFLHLSPLLNRLPLPLPLPTLPFHSLILDSLPSASLSTLPPYTLFLPRYLSLVRPEDGDEYRPEVFLSGRMHDFKFAVITQLPSPPKTLCDRMYTIRVVPQRDPQF